MTRLYFYFIGLMLALIHCSNAYSQEYEEENDRVYQKLDQSIFKGKISLNKAIYHESILEPFWARRCNIHFAKPLIYRRHY